MGPPSAFLGLSFSTRKSLGFNQMRGRDEVFAVVTGYSSVYESDVCCSVLHSQLPRRWTLVVGNTMSHGPLFKTAVSPCCRIRTVMRDDRQVWTA